MVANKKSKKTKYFLLSKRFWLSVVSALSWITTIDASLFANHMLSIGLNPKTVTVFSGSIGIISLLYKSYINFNEDTKRLSLKK